MKIHRTITFLILAALGPANQTLAATAEEAENLVHNAIVYFQAYGPTQAFKAFQDRNGEFVNDELHILALDLDGYVYANASAPRFLGKNVLDLTSAAGEPIIRHMIRLANQRRAGWYEYEWRHPDTQRIEHKAAFVQRIPNSEYWVACSYSK